jgi:hypothetical protein
MEQVTSKSAALNEALCSLVALSIESQAQELKGRIVADVRNLGKGWHYRVGRHPQDTTKVLVVVYIHGSTDSREFVDTVNAAATAAIELLNERVPVPLSVLLPLRDSSPEIDAILRKRGY